MQQRAQLSQDEQMFLSMADQLSRPFTQITRLAELADNDDANTAALRWQTVHALADSSLRLVENYALSLRINGNVTPLAIEPITVSSLLYETATALEPFAKQYGVELELQTGPPVQPILADRSVLSAAMTSLGQVFVLAQAEAEQPATVHLAAHRSRYGVVAGLYGTMPALSVESLRRGRTLQGRARQPLPNLVSGPAAGVFVADSLLQALAARLHVARYHNLTGLAATLTPSQQMQLV